MGQEVDRRLREKWIIGFDSTGAPQVFEPSAKPLAGRFPYFDEIGLIWQILIFVALDGCGNALH